jgi:isoquinoline 1-oxidoreductase alpha subunit
MTELLINGAKFKADVEPTASLLWVIRENLKLTGTKYGCGEGACGSCTILVNGEPMRSCQMTVKDVEGKAITTIEGIAQDHPVKKAWISEEVSQCGYCQPGQILEAIALLKKNPNPSHEQIVGAMDGVLCRCGTYPRIIRAIQKVASNGGSK